MQLALELGSSWIRGARSGEPVAFSQPSLVAREANSQKDLALGEEAASGSAGPPTAVQLLRPVRSGRILDWNGARALLQLAMRHLHKKRGRPEVALVVPAEISLVQRRSWKQLAQEAGAGQVQLLESPLCCGAGCGCDVSRPLGRLVMNWGGGSLDLGLVAGRQMLAGVTLNLGGLDLDAALQRWMRQKHGLLISLQQAEEVKKALLSAMPGEMDKSMEMTGFGAIDGLPKTVEVTQSSLAPSLEPFLLRLREGVLSILGRATPEVSADLLEEGLWCCGGSAGLAGLKDFLEQVCGLRMLPVQAPEQAAVRGLAEWLRAGS